MYNIKHLRAIVHRCIIQGLQKGIFGTPKHSFLKEVPSLKDIFFNDIGSIFKGCRPISITN